MAFFDITVNFIIQKLKSKHLLCVRSFWGNERKYFPHIPGPRWCWLYAIFALFENCWLNCLSQSAWKKTSVLQFIRKLCFKTKSITYKFDHFTTISGHFFANYMNIFHKTYLGARCHFERFGKYSTVGDSTT